MKNNTGKSWFLRDLELAHGQMLSHTYNRKTVFADIYDGFIRLPNQKMTVFPSKASWHVGRTKRGGRPHISGWKYWKVLQSDGTWVKLKDLIKKVKR